MKDGIIVVTERESATRSRLFRKCRKKCDFTKEHLYIKLLQARIVRNYMRMTEQIEEYLGLNLAKARKVLKKFIDHNFYKVIEQVYGYPLTVSKTGLIELIHYDLSDKFRLKTK